MRKKEKMLSVCLSFLFSGLGLIYNRRWISGILFGCIHIIMWFFLLRYFVIYIAYHVTVADGVMGNAPMVFGILITAILLNTIVSTILSAQSAGE